MILPLPSTTPFGADVAADVVAVAAVVDDVEDAATMLRVKRFVVALKKKLDDISSHYFFIQMGQWAQGNTETRPDTLACFA